MKNFMDVIMGTLISWVMVYILVRVVAACFGLTFSWSMAFGVWLILVFLKPLKIWFLEWWAILKDSLCSR